MSPLFDKLIDLAKTRQENREKLFTGFVEPTYQSFDAAHSNYLASFQKYRDAIVERSDPTDEDIKQLQGLLLTDSLFHWHIRQSAINEADVLRESKRHDFMPFIDSITKYFEGPIPGKSDLVKKVNEFVRYANGARAVLFMALELLRTSLQDGRARSSITVEGLDEIIEWLQSQHAVVQRHYLQAKKKLKVS